VFFDLDIKMSGNQIKERGVYRIDCRRLAETTWLENDSPSCEKNARAPIHKTGAPGPLWGALVRRARRKTPDWNQGLMRRERPMKKSD
jgi:hypothetical protein